ncbi:DUF1801 domain-containing protein [Persicobacter psychrovividus]|uniref:YdhG-like domain-containing protein n=1 Tax=Persicobacter psychrovividus TaxID=387638 RepID=A0ABM7VKL0_9BACT|nr:hypothetical protein PEPS_37850 [Persicobacter psychrovividus]
MGSVHVDHWIAQRPAPQRQMFEELRYLIKSQSSDISEKISWSIPFFYFNGPLCYLKPDAEGGIAVSFMKGYLMDQTEFPLLEQQGRKQVRSILLQSVEEIASSNLEIYLQVAMSLNAEK